MKLYYAPGACSLSPHFEPVLADLKTHKLQDGGDFYAINSKGSVPVLELDDGERLTEGPAIVQYIADQAPARNLAPANGTLARARLQEWLNFITSELHKGFGPLFNPATPDEYKTMAKAKLIERFGWVDKQLSGKQYLMGDSFSAADPYLFVVTLWAGRVGIDLASLANLKAYAARVAARPAVQEAMKAEGLTK